MGIVTVFYYGGTAAVFASEEEALAQAAHDLSFPGHRDPSYIVEGDNVEVSPNEARVLHDQNAVAQLVCECHLCEFQRQAPALDPERRAELWEQLRMEAQTGARS